MRVRISMMLLACVLLAVAFSETVDAKKHKEGKYSKEEKNGEIKQKGKDYKKHNEKYNNEKGEKKYSKENKAVESNLKKEDKKVEKSEKNKYKEPKADKKQEKKVENEQVLSDKKATKGKEAKKETVKSAENAKREKRSVLEEQPVVVVEEIIEPMESEEAEEEIEGTNTETVCEKSVPKSEIPESIEELLDETQQQKL